MFYSIISDRRVPKKIPYVGGVKNVSVTRTEDIAHIKWDFPKIQTPENSAMKLCIDVKIRASAPLSPIAEKELRNKNLEGVSFPVKKGFEYLVEVTPRLFCLGENYGPTTKIFVTL